MPTPRADFTATLLLNGQVLLAGGRTSATADTAYADFFDPATKSISPAARMKAARNGHTATLLSDGRVLVAGGFGAPNGLALASAEIYNPVNNSWADAASMAVPRGHHVATLMTNGKVYIVGGDGGAPAPADPAMPEVYDPRTNTWTAAPFVFGTRPFGPAATALTDGRVMVIGGVSLIMRLLFVEFYDPATAQATPGRFEPAGDRNFVTAAQLSDGTVIVVGGQSSNNPAAPNTTDLYDPSKENSTCVTAACSAWTSGPPMNANHCSHTMTALKNGLLLVTGGQCNSNAAIAVAELYDPAAKRWLPTGPLGEARVYHVAVLLPDGRVLVAGGVLASGLIGISTEVYTPA